MKRDVYLVLFAQFLTAFADNAILFTAITMVTQAADTAAWYVPALQASFLVAFVFLAPWVGPYADNRPKAHVMTTANVVKGAGAGLMIVPVEPLLAFAVVGLGAAMYSPAKYGILPELVEEHQLVKANGWVEGSTILAILAGMLVGALLSEQSITLALAVVIGLYAVSALVALWITRLPVQERPRRAALPHFVGMTRRLLSTPRARFSTLGVSLFWAASVVLRVTLVAWAPVALLITQTSKIAELTMFLAFGIALGALLAARFIPLAYLRRARMAAYAMGTVVVALSFVDNIWVARAVLFMAGVAGGMFAIPINAALQEIGHKSIGAGGAVAVQNFFENMSMLVASGLYAAAVGLGALPVPTIATLGVLVLIATFVVSWHLPPDTGAIADAIPSERS
jgi:LPLT family lysophospholipid transporter-like MFS transporter